MKDDFLLKMIEMGESLAEDSFAQQLVIWPSLISLDGEEISWQQLTADTPRHLGGCQRAMEYLQTTSQADAMLLSDVCQIRDPQKGRMNSTLLFRGMFRGEEKLIAHCFSIASRSLIFDRSILELKPALKLFGENEIDIGEQGSILGIIVLPDLPPLNSDPQLIDPHDELPF